MKKIFLFKYINKYKWTYILGLLALLAVDYLNLYIPVILANITDGLSINNIDIKQLITYIIYLLSFSLCIALGRVLWRLLIFGSARRVEYEVTNAMFAKLETLSCNYFNTHKTGDLMANFTNDIEALRNAIGPAIVSSFDSIVMTIMVLYKMMVFVDLKLTLLCLIPMSIIAIGGYYFGEEFEKRFANKQNAFAKVSDYVQETISSSRVVKAFVQEDKQDIAFGKINEYNKQQNLKVVKLMATIMPLLEMVIGSSYVVTIIDGGYLSIVHKISLGKFVAFNSYISMLVWPMIALGDAITSFTQGLAAISRLDNIFNQESEIQDRSNAIDLKIEGNIKVSNLSFKYQDHLPEVLSNINFELKKGETLAIIGHTGDGKSTLVNLLLHLYNVDDGHIYFDDHDINDIKLDCLRSSISYVPQDSYLFSDSIKNNIAFGKDNVDMDEIENVCKLACVHDNIIDFPEGYDTIVGERGVTLSGGQKQRCAIARALLKQSPILILDDALSAVDTDTESNILNNLQRTQKQTLIMIAHRISTVKRADHIMVLDDGRIVEYGDFDSLIQLNGTFKKMFDKQQLEFQIAKE